MAVQLSIGPFRSRPFTLGCTPPLRGGLSAGDFAEDLVGGFGPDKGSGLSLRWETQQSIRVSSSVTEMKLVLVKALRLSNENQH